MVVKLKNYINVNKICLAGILAVVIISAFQLSVCSTWGDDAVWKGILSTSSWYSNYTRIVGLGGGSSRLIIDGVWFFLLTLPLIIWKIISIIINTLTVYTLVKTYGNTNQKYDWLMAIVVFFIYPFYHMCSAGWLATTITYWWSACCCIITVCICHSSIKTNQNMFWTILCLLTCIYGIDDELGCVFLLIAIGIMIIYSFINKTLCKLMIVSEILTTLRLIVHLYWQSHGSRMDAATLASFPDFQMQNLIDKAQAGFSSACYMIFHEESYVLFALCFVIASLVWTSTDITYKRIISALPLFWCCAEGVFRQQLETIFKFYDHIDLSYTEKYGVISNANYYSMDNYMLLGIWIIALTCILSSLISLLDSDSIVIIGILLAGLLSRAAMGFSPTIAASSTRPYVFLFWSIMFTTLYLLYKNKNNKSLRFIIPTLTAITFLSYLNTLLAGMATYYRV